MHRGTTACSKGAFLATLAPGPLPLAVREARASPRLSFPISLMTQAQSRTVGADVQSSSLLFSLYLRSGKRIHTPNCVCMCVCERVRAHVCARLSMCVHVRVCARV